MVKAVYQFYMYYHIRQILKRLQAPLPYKLGLDVTNNPYSSVGLFKLCEDYEVPHNPMSYHNEKFFETHQHGGWSDYIGPDSVTRWIIKKCQRLTNIVLFRMSESIRAYMYLILSSQAFTRLCIVGNKTSALLAQEAFLNTFENIVNQRVDIWKDIKPYQNTHSYASGKVD